MWIKTTVILSLTLATLASEKKDDRGKRQLQYVAHYNAPHAYRLERRISTGPQIPLYHPQYFPGPRSHSPYHKGRPRSLPAPPYAVQMEPLIHYSQRDPLYETNALSSNADGPEDLITDNNHISEHYGPQKHIVERPVYIKEPEPIIEIIIKESNVTLPPPPAPPAPPPKKKEEVQVFYVKYKKNPHGQGKDSIIYEKPVPAISPPIQDEQEEAPPEHHHHHEVVTSPPPPSTTLRTIIRPDSETYHSPSGVKVTFGKEGFDYDKRSSKAEDLKASSDDSKSIQFPQGRQLSSFDGPRSSFSDGPRRPVYSFTPPPTTNFRQPQPYRPFNQFRQQFVQSFGRPNQEYSTLPKTPFPQQPKSPEYSTLPKTPQFAQHKPQEYSTLPKSLTQSNKPDFSSAPKFPQFSQPPKNFPPARPAPPQFHRQPVPYQPFDSLRQPSVPFRPETHFPITNSPPVTQKPILLSQFNRHSKPQFSQQPFGQHQQQQEFPRQHHQTSEFQQRPGPEFHQTPEFQQQQRPTPEFQQQHQTPEFPAQHQQTEFQQFQQQFQQYQQQVPHVQQQQQFNPQASVIPPGGELIQSVPKYEQHISVNEPLGSKVQNQFESQEQYQVQPQVQQHVQPQIQHQIQPQLQQSSVQISDYNKNKVQQDQHQSSLSYKEKIQQQLREANALQESIRGSTPQYNFQQQQNFYQSTSRPSYSSTTTTTTTTTPKPSTTTKDPKILNAQLPDEVPDDLREQLLSSGILNNAQISVLDYDKVGDIPLSALPPDQLANFYNAGGAQQIQAAGSEPVPAIADRDFKEEASEKHEVKVKPEVQMKVVRYDPDTEKGQQVQEEYVKDGAKQVDPVALNDAKYNRYLPLKISGAQFPIPDVPELKGKKVSSVVVLAPVSYDFSSSRKTREAKEEEIELLKGKFLKTLLEKPTKENFQKFLEQENQTKSEEQAVILLVASPSEDGKEKEIFMYDIATKTVSKLDGELSTAFVEAAEANSSESKTSASSIIETRVPVPESADLATAGSENLESFVDVSGLPVDLTASETRLSQSS